MKKRLLRPASFVFLVLVGLNTALSQGGEKRGQVARESNRSDPREAEPPMSGPERDALQMIKEGRQTFRFDTFGDEEFWGDALKLHQAIAGKKLGGVGPGVSPKTALAVGLKVDMDALPPDLVRQIKAEEGRSGRPGHHARPAQAGCGRRREGLLRTKAERSGRSASPVPSATRRWMTPSPPASAIGWTAGPTAT